jgi:hypothetical protein
MINPFTEVNWKPDLEEKRKFALSLVLGFPCLALVLILVGWIAKGRWDANLNFALALALGGASAGGLFWLFPLIVRPLYVTWYFVACCMGIVMGNFLLAGFFFLVLTPIGLLKRVFLANGFSKGFDNKADTYWNDASPPKDPAAYYKQY